MKDYEALTKMLERTDIQYTTERTASGGTIVYVERGYAGFVTQFEFDAQDKLLDMGAYE